MPDFPHPFSSDSPLYYNVGVWGERGYAIPNPGPGVNPAGQTLNKTIEEFCTEGGRRLSIILHHADGMRVDPPSRNTVERIIMFINRARTKLVGRAIAENQEKFEGAKVRSRRLPLRVFPCPYFQVDNRLMYDFGTAAFSCLSELMRSSENLIEHDITVELSEVALRYIKRFQRDLAMDYFGMPRTEAEALDLDLMQHLDKYTPSAYGYVSGEAYDDIDTISFPSEIDLGPLAKGILVQHLPPGLGPYPYEDAVPRTDPTTTTAGAKAASSAAVPPFPEPASYRL